MELSPSSAYDPRPDLQGPRAVKNEKEILPAGVEVRMEIFAEVRSPRCRFRGAGGPSPRLRSWPAGPLQRPAAVTQQRPAGPLQRPLACSITTRFTQQRTSSPQPLPIDYCSHRPSDSTPSTRGQLAQELEAVLLATASIEFSVRPENPPTGGPGISWTLESHPS